MIEIDPQTERERAMWLVLLDLARQEPHWTLIGARMVELHAMARGVSVSRTTVDADALADARQRPSAVTRLAEILVDAGFVLADPTAFGLAHTFTRDGVEIDVLAPEHLGEHGTGSTVTVSPARTVEVPGGRQALARSELVEVSVKGTIGALPRPNLLGAILVKARAVDVSDVKEAQRSDLALLLSFVDDPESFRRDLAGNEAQWLRHRREMDDPSAACWRGLTETASQRGLSALRILTHG